ncbi:DegV family protein [Pediococcus pentosaceus]|uniref:DegV family protein n=1 Tax=Pediococcus pentosaceus TaxID=1255 RepID=UPI002119B9B4|nr:DegV family protein [Pediococcus pentosaceus]MCQ9196270.1 DegV family protein [Pediococcus pentosaceus]
MNQSKTAIVIDSSANIAPEIVRKYHFTIVNQPVMFGKHVYHENMDIDSDEFYRMLKLEKYHPTASQIPMKEMQEVFSNLAQAGYEAALCIGLSGGLSGFINSVSASVPAIKDLQVYLYDSGSILAGVEKVAILASHLLDNGVDIHEVLHQMRKYRRQTQAYIAVNNIKELQNMGNISNRTSLVGSFFGMRPILTINHQGRLEMVGKERQMKNAMEAIEEIFDKQLVDHTNLVVTVIDANDVDRSMQWQSTLKAKYPGMQVESRQIGPYVGTYTGSKAIGLIWSPKL